MEQTAVLRIDDKEYSLPVMVGTEGEKAVDTRKLRAASGFMSYDQGYGNTCSCESSITYLDGEKGILRHRGYPIEQLAEHSDFVETAYLIIYGDLPNAARRKEFGLYLRQTAAIEPQIGFARSAVRPMTGKTVLGQDRTDRAVVAERLLGAGHGGQAQCRAQAKHQADP